MAAEFLDGKVEDNLWVTQYNHNHLMMSYGMTSSRTLDGANESIINYIIIIEMNNR